MSVSVAQPAPARARFAGAASRARAAASSRPELLALLALAAVLDLWSLSRNGWANTYYSAAVRSMSQSWHAFLYASFDAQGAMTVDKPPLAFWVQALSVRAFGFNSAAILVPQALMGVATVGLAYDLVRRRFGRIAGFAGGLTLALTPIAVAISRHNNPDALLVLCVVAALWFAVRALEDGRTRWLVWCGVCVGLGFEAKMGAALLVVPAIAAAYAWVAPRGRLAAARQLLAGGAAMAVVGLAWPVLVALTPASDRPWISGTADNSIWSLIFGYNGLGRLAGQSGGPAGGGPGGGPGGGAGPGGLFGGDTGVTRLLNDALGGQAGWLLGFALVSGIAVAVVSRLRRRDGQTGWILAVGGAALTIAVAFSFASGIFHPYYVSELAPFVAMLVGAGVGVLASGGVAARVLAPLALTAGVVTEIWVLREHPESLAGWGGILAAGVAVAAFALGFRISRPARLSALGTGLALLLIAPATWAFQTLGHATEGTFPAGGPASAQAAGPGGRFVGPPGGFAGGPGRAFAPGGTVRGGFAGGGGPFGGGAGLSAALAYTRAHGGGAVAVASQQAASEEVLTGAQDVVAIGGFSGRESEVSVQWLAAAVRSGHVRWVLGDEAGMGLPKDNRVGASKVLAAAGRVGQRIQLSSGVTLYDLSGRADALASAG